MFYFAVYVSHGRVAQQTNIEFVTQSQPCTHQSKPLVSLS